MEAQAPRFSLPGGQGRCPWGQEASTELSLMSIAELSLSLVLGVFGDRPGSLKETVESLTYNSCSMRNKPR